MIANSVLLTFSCHMNMKLLNSISKAVSDIGSSKKQTFQLGRKIQIVKNMYPQKCLKCVLGQAKTMGRIGFSQFRGKWQGTHIRASHSYLVGAGQCRVLDPLDGSVIGFLNHLQEFHGKPRGTEHVHGEI